MDFPDGLFPAPWCWAAFATLAPILGWAIATAPWRRVRDSTQLHGWLGTIVVVMLVWRMNAGIRPGLGLHLLGATTMTLMFGRRLAIVGLAIVMAAVTLSGGGGWHAYALNVLVLAVLPVILAHGIWRIVEHLLPRHLFVYIFVTAFFGAAVTVALTGLAAILLLAVADVYPMHLLLTDYFPSFVLMGFAEAWMNGAAITLLVVYFPLWVGTFVDHRYLLK